MKFIHIADVHLDCIFSNLADKSNLGEKRRLEQRKILRKVIEYIKINNVDALFIAGDLYEEKYITASTIEYINALFSEIVNTKIYIAPGNHDPYIKNSFYDKFNWSKNVHVFKNKVEKMELEDINIYGYGFCDFYDDGTELLNFKINEEDRKKINILITHADLDKTKTNELNYNPIGKSILESKGFDYCALGHIHKTNFDEYKNVVYPGSVMSLGFDEVGKHGMVEGVVENGEIRKKYVELEDVKFCDKEIDVSDIEYFEKLIEILNCVETQNRFTRVILIGERNFEINKNKIYSLIENNNIIKIKNKTTFKINLDELENDHSLKGIFVKKINSKVNNIYLNSLEKNKLERILEVGLEALK